MARPRAFDEEAVLDQAVEVFRRRGYAALGVAELTEALGLSRSSLYATFGSKQDLWLAALQRYRHAETAALRALLEDGDGASDGILDRVIGLLDGVLIALAHPATSACLVVNAACERGGIDTATTEQVAAQVEELRDLLRGALYLARATGEISEDADVDGLAALLATVLQGARVTGRVSTGGGVAAPAIRHLQAHLRGLAT